MPWAPGRKVGDLPLEVCLGTSPTPSLATKNNRASFEATLKKDRLLLSHTGNAAAIGEAVYLALMMIPERQKIIRKFREK